MKNIFRILGISLFIMAFVHTSNAVETQFGNFKSTENIKSTAAGCGAPSGFRFLTVNNVKARINTGGDMWWDLPGGIGAQYFIPANSSSTSLFSGSLWIGGLDINNQLKLAALRYRQVGQDYWTGPLTIDGTAAIDDETCTEWDKFFMANRADVDEYIQHTDTSGAFIPSADYQIPKWMSKEEYPAHGDIEKGQSYYLAPFKDADGDGNYDPERGDYPYYDVENELCPLNFAGDPDYVPAPTLESEEYEYYFGGILVDQVLKGDQTLWWVFNDKGNFHSETNGAAIGMEIHAQAFGFATNDEVNNMTFYTYEIVNRSTYVLTQTYFSPWVDTDLGYGWDDYVGCDVERGLGYCYNGLPTDEGGPEAYGAQPPAIGVDFFQGPYMDPDTCDNPAYKGDGLLGPSFPAEDCRIVSQNGIEITMNYGLEDEFSGVFKVQSEAINGVNFGNGIVDDERYGMRRFVYHSNIGPAYSTDPDNAPEYYNFLRGIWKDNTRMLYGGNAHASTGAGGPECDFMFPGDSDPCNWGTQGQPPANGLNANGEYWTEELAQNNPGDRRFMQSAGPFTLKPGAVNYITVGIPWARAIAGGPWESVKLLRVVDDKAQALFDNCFKVVNGPDAPDLSFKELSNEVIVYITNSPNSNNYLESYEEIDPQIKALTPDELIGTSLAYDPYYRFEGYQIFQLRDADVTVSDSRYDPDMVRLVAQYDVQNGVGKLVNYKFDRSIGGNVPVVEVEGGDNGISHSFILNEDAFASGDRRLINNKQYFFSAVAYGYNNYKDYDPSLPTQLDGQKKPYLEGRKNIQLYTIIPNIPINGVIANSQYGDGPLVTRIDGQGNGGKTLELTDESIEELLSKSPAGPTAGGGTIEFGDEDYPILYNPVYKDGFGPVNIRVIDPLNISNAKYSIRFDTSFAHYTYYNVTGGEEVEPGGDTAGVQYTKQWLLTDESTGKEYSSEVGTNIEYEQLFTEIGLSVSFGPVFYPGLYKVGEKYNAGGGGTPPSYDDVNVVMAQNNGLIESSLEYSDSSMQWLGGVQDFDVNNSFNWIRSGTSFNDGSPFDDWRTQLEAFDPEENYEKIVGGTWAPYFMCSYGDQDPNGAAPVYSFGGSALSKELNLGLAALASVDIVFTPDRSKWTRCPVLEMCDEEVLAEGNAKRFDLRKAPSVDKEGNSSGWPGEKDASLNPDDPNYIMSHGMGWFPGYAINLETGERMNMMFGEDSWLGGDNGRDMLFNPSPNYTSFPTGSILFGGKHYVYVLSSGEFTKITVNDTISYKFPAYDAGSSIAYAIDTIPAGFEGVYKPIILSSPMYVGIPLSMPDVPWLANEAKIRIRVAKPYEKYYAKPADLVTENDNYPMYEFSTENLATTQYSQSKAETDLDLINVVPNPYYAYSSYELVPLENKVKVTNLPEKCVVSIYNVSGNLIRKFTKDDPVTYIDWDLKNHAGIPIAGGVYLVHVKDETTGQERIVKWFGSLRIEDFNEF